MELRDIQASLRANIVSRSTQVGPFLVLINAESDNPFRNYAVPDEGATPTEADVAALIRYFSTRDRYPRLEYVRPSPAVDTALEKAFFDVNGTLTLMALADGGPSEPAADGYRVMLVTDDERLRQVSYVQNIAYGEADQEPAIDGLQRTIKGGGSVALAVHAATGEPAGAGLSTEPQGGLVEIAGVGVLPEHRRHGVGALVTWALSAEALRRGNQPFLQVEKDEPLRVYQRIGYEVIGEMADARSRNIDRPTPKPPAGEAETLLGFLDYVRFGLINKLAGLDGAAARRSLVPSGTTLLWLVKHCREVERFWLHHGFADQPATGTIDDVVTDDDTPEDVIAEYRVLAAVTTEFVVTCPDLTESADNPTRTLRWSLVHLIEEIGRHAGHADILREQIDGTIGR